MFDCLKNGCGKAVCCGNIGFTKECWDRNKQKVQVSNFVVTPLPSGDLFVETPNNVCVFLDRQTKKCVIYEDRPNICKMYGTKEILPCPFLLPDGSPRPAEKMKDWENAFNKTLDDVTKLKDIENNFSERLLPLRRKY